MELWTFCCDRYLSKLVFVQNCAFQVYCHATKVSVFVALLETSRKKVVSLISLNR